MQIFELCVCRMIEIVIYVIGGSYVFIYFMYFI